MTVEYIRYVLNHHAPDQFVAAYQEAGKALQASPECISYELAQCDEDANAFILRIHWTSKNDHLHGFRAGPHFGAFFQAIGPFVQEIVEMRHYEATGVEWAR
jgi:hypothetical protein